MSKVEIYFAGSRSELIKPTGMAVTAYAAHLIVEPPIPQELLQTVLGVEKPENVCLKHTDSTLNYGSNLVAQLGPISAPAAQAVLTNIAIKIEEVHTADSNISWGHVQHHREPIDAIRGLRTIQTPRVPHSMLEY